VNADPAAQGRLLDIADHDLRIGQLKHKRDALPEAKAAADLRIRLERLDAEIIAAETIVSDLTREQSRADADVDLVRQRIAKDQTLLTEINDSKQLQSIQHELESLARRQADLEDVELEIMERVEGAEAAVRQLQGERTSAQAELAALDASIAEQYAVIDGELEVLTGERVQLTSTVPADLMGLYEKIRADHGGVGAARLIGGRCDGCQLELPPTEREQVRNAAPEAVVRCEECRRILIRETIA
jgi:predicted  nucleic acid-binding Zn-ribbon protein